MQSWNRKIPPPRSFRQSKGPLVRPHNYTLHRDCPVITGLGGSRSPGFAVLGGTRLCSPCDSVSLWCFPQGFTLAPAQAHENHSFRANFKKVYRSSTTCAVQEYGSTHRFTEMSTPGCAWVSFPMQRRQSGIKQMSECTGTPVQSAQSFDITEAL